MGELGSNADSVLPITATTGLLWSVRDQVFTGPPADAGGVKSKFFTMGSVSFLLLIGERLRSVWRGACLAAMAFEMRVDCLVAMISQLFDKAEEIFSHRLNAPLPYSTMVSQKIEQRFK